MTLVLHRHGKHRHPRIPHSMLRRHSGNHGKLLWRFPYVLNNSQFVVSTRACALGCASNHQLQALLCLFALQRASHTANPTTIGCASSSIRALFDPHVFEKKKRQTNGTPILTTLHTTQLCLMFLNCFCKCFNFYLHSDFQVLELHVLFGDLAV